MIGTTLGRYKQSRLVGRGGMAEVYEATDEKLDRRFAVKIVLPHMPFLSSETVKERLQQGTPQYSVVSICRGRCLRGSGLWRRLRARLQPQQDPRRGGRRELDKMPGSVSISGGQTATTCHIGMPKERVFASFLQSRRGIGKTGIWNIKTMNKGLRPLRLNPNRGPQPVSAPVLQSLRMRLARTPNKPKKSSMLKRFSKSFRSICTHTENAETRNCNYGPRK